MYFSINFQVNPKIPYNDSLNSLTHQIFKTSFSIFKRGQCKHFQIFPRHSEIMTNSRFKKKSFPSVSWIVCVMPLIAWKLREKIKCNCFDLNVIAICGIICGIMWAYECCEGLLVIFTRTSCYPLCHKIYDSVVHFRERWPRGNELVS